ncbi:MAG: hypothetical protein CMN78_00415 [Spirochaetales bacterium]|nr:hypothetical protein [Spirochaetales bacterium]
MQNQLQFDEPNHQPRGRKTKHLRIGTCSWKYPSWQSLVYSGTKNINFLEEYAKRYNTVEIDQWFWSLFGEDKISLPRADTVDEYCRAVPGDFKFTIKAPNSITLTHFYRHLTGGKLVPNPHFISKPLLNDFLASIKPLHPYLGLVMLQFEYLNKQKMENLAEFLDCIDQLLEDTPEDIRFALEPRNPNFFTKRYFTFLSERGLSHVFIQGYYMPEITEVYWKYRDLVTMPVVVRLHGYDRDEIEKKTRKQYHSIVAPKDDELPGVIKMVQDLRERGVDVYLNVNNHYEGSAPLTIEKIRGLISDYL